MRWWYLLCTRPTCLKLDFYSAHWNNISRIDMSPSSDTLFWFGATQSLLFLLNAVCLAVKQQKPILVSHDGRSSLRSMSMLTITPPMRFFIQRIFWKSYQKWVVLYFLKKKDLLFNVRNHTLFSSKIFRHRTTYLILVSISQRSQPRQPPILMVALFSTTIKTGGCRGRDRLIHNYLCN
jgi:hypothetical protein